jgi:hypothetical protein
MELQDFVQRARSALSMPTLYWLSYGGCRADEAQQPAPGRAIDLERELELMRTGRPAVFQAYMAGLGSLGLDRAALPRVACDCSGFVCWALGVPRDGAPLHGGWINTDAIVEDAKGGQRLFVPVEKAVPGALLVHPKPSGIGNVPGHVAIVIEADANGRATRMLHCAPENYLLEPPAGLPRNAIAETDTSHFDAIATTQLVMWKAFER